MGGWAVCLEEGMSLADTSFGVTGPCVGPFLSRGPLTPQGTPPQLTQ